MKKIKHVCRHCKSDAVLADSTSIWNQETQEWEVNSVFMKNGYCEQCDGLCNIEDVELTEAEKLEV